MSKAWDRAMTLMDEWEYVPAIRDGVASLIFVLKKVEWEGGGTVDDSCLDYYDDGVRAAGFCPCCFASKDRGHKPRCKLASLLGAKTVTDKQAAINAEKAQQARWRAQARKDRIEREKCEAEWQAHLATLTPEQRAEEEHKRARRMKCARALRESTEKAFLFGCEPSPLSKLLGMTKGIGAFIATNVAEGEPA